MSVFSGLGSFVNGIGDAGRRAEDFGRQRVHQALDFGQRLPGQVETYAHDNKAGLIDQALIGAIGGPALSLALGPKKSEQIVNFAKGHAGQAGKFTLGMLQDAPTAIVNLAETGVGKAAHGLSKTTLGKYVSANKDGLIDAALLGTVGLMLGPNKSEKLFAQVGERVADPMSRLYHNPAFQAVGGALNQSATIFSNLSAALPDPAGAMFGAAGIATEAWYGAFLATGTFDGSVSTSDALAPARKAAEGLAQMEVSKILDRLTQGKEEEKKVAGVFDSYNKIKATGLKKFIASGAHTLLRKYRGELLGTGVHYRRLLKNHEIVKGVYDLLTLSNNIYDKYDKFSGTKLGKAINEGGGRKINNVFHSF